MELEQIKEKIKNLQNKREEFCSHINKELRELEKLRVKQEPKITDFAEYEGKNINHISAIDSKGDNVFLPTDEIAKIENGKPYFSSYENGIVFFDFEKQKYVSVYRYKEEELDIVGFYDLEFEDDCFTN